jgi:O-antigen ligase
MKRFFGIFKNTGTIEEKLLWLYIAIMPITSISFFTFIRRNIICADFVFIVLFIIYLLKYIQGKIKIEKTSLELSLFAMISLFSISIINSVYLIDSFLELTGLTYLVIFFLLIINIISNPQRLRRLLYVYVFISGIVSLIGLASFCYVTATGKIIGNPFFQYTTIESMAHHFPRLQLTFGTPNMFLFYLHTALICAAILFLSETNHHAKKIFFICITVIVWAALLTGSRRFTGFILSSLIILLIFGKGRLALLLKGICFIGLSVFLIMSFITSVWVIFPVNITMDEVDKTVGLQVHYSYSLHLLQPVTSINMIKSHPFIGVGLGTYNWHFKENVDWKWVLSSFDFKAYPEYLKVVKDNTLNFDPHSAILGTLAETGIVGLLGLLYFFVKYTRKLLFRFKTNRELNFEKILSGCILAGFIGFLLNGLFTDIVSMRYFWFIMAIGLSCNKLYIKEGTLNVKRP